MSITDEHDPRDLIYHAVNTKSRSSSLRFSGQFSSSDHNVASNDHEVRSHHDINYLSNKKISNKASAWDIDQSKHLRKKTSHELLGLFIQPMVEKQVNTCT